MTVQIFDSFMERIGVFDFIRNVLEYEAIFFCQEQIVGHSKVKRELPICEDDTI